ncbi:class I adenylate-forming enzyme family protein [Nocardioides sp. L-11A]|uniref:class I adenylate-forming enzyme family protein n=1 Tax=Nocardioides sp. L-11A TaxID=3043848 RepID=UPI00249B2CDC|nr:AMP-binding protein [Nocardioides sp. L-11A]
MSRTLAAAWADRLADAPGAVAMSHRDRRWTRAELDRAAGALAATFADRGVRAGDRVGIRLQNVPAFPVALLASWRLGAVPLVLNPMYTARELHVLLADSGAVGVLCAADDLSRVVEAGGGTALRWTLTAEELGDDLGSAGDPDRDLPPSGADPADPALMIYTSGTTGPPKGALSSHANVLATVDGYADWLGLVEGDVSLAIAPLFHTTGAVASAAIALVRGLDLVLIGRFDPGAALAAIREHRVTFTVGAITAFTALGQHPDASPETCASLRVAASGGAPIAPATVALLEERLGCYIHNVYGMTETTSAVVAVPTGQRAPVDPVTGSLSVGVCLPDVRARVLDPDGRELGPGEVGELELSGPSMMLGYHDRPTETAQTLREGWLRTGDGGSIDADGWIYLADRLKDQINASGFKVWPREVEDVLCEHPAVLEVAVVGRPDAYRGETVVAFVALAAGRTASPAELVEHARGRLAAYKVPREITVLEQLPKTATGKIQRRELRVDPA